MQTLKDVFFQWLLGDVLNAFIDPELTTDSENLFPSYMALKKN